MIKQPDAASVMRPTDLQSCSLVALSSAACTDDPL